MATTTLSQLLGTHLDQYLKTHRLPLYQHKALDSYRHCRTAKLGGHTQVCENGHLMGVWYNSCKRRGCPQCLGLPSERWLQQQKSILLDQTHHHWVFTLPHELLPLWRYNRALMQDILFECVAKTIKELSKDKKYLGATPAFNLTLHTWGRNLSLHPHIHCLIAHGGLSKDQWQAPTKRILFPSKVMRALFRGKVRSALRNAELTLPPSMTDSDLNAMIMQLGRKPWVVHCCKPYKHGRGVASYLSRYVKAGALQGKRMSALKKGQLQLRYRSHRTQRYESQHLSAKEFIRRVCDHIPQHYKSNTRHYGLYHPRKRDVLNIARFELGQAKVKQPEPIHPLAYLAQQTDIPRCVQCKAPLKGLSVYLENQ